MGIDAPMKPGLSTSEKIDKMLSKQDNIVTKQDAMSASLNELKTDFKTFKATAQEKLGHLDKKVACHDVELSNVKENIKRNHNNSIHRCKTDDNCDDDDKDETTEKSLIELIKDQNTAHLKTITMIVGIVATVCTLVTTIAIKLLGG
jgi:hypothetical protein